MKEFRGNEKFTAINFAFSITSWKKSNFAVKPGQSEKFRTHICSGLGENASLVRNIFKALAHVS